MFTRMLIFETSSGTVSGRVLTILRTEVFNLMLETERSGLVATEILTEQDGSMVIFNTTWKTREAALRYHSSRNYRGLVSELQPMLTGNPVVKLFENHSGVKDWPVGLERIARAVFTSDSSALFAIQRLMNRRDYDADTCEEIAEIVRGTGREIGDLASDCAMCGAPAGEQCKETCGGSK